MNLETVRGAWSAMESALSTARSEPGAVTDRAAAYSLERVRALLDLARCRSETQVWLRQILLEAVDRRVAGLLAGPEV
jgi:hypothetical protein